MDQVSPLTKWAVLSPWALNFLSPMDCPATLVTGSENDLIRTLDPDVGTSPTHVKNFFNWCIFPIQVLARSTYLVAVAFTVSRVGAAIHGTKAVFHYAQYRWLNFQDRSYADTSDAWQKTEAYGHAFFSDLCFAITGGLSAWPFFEMGARLLNALRFIPVPAGCTKRELYGLSFTNRRECLALSAITLLFLFSFSQALIFEKTIPSLLSPSKEDATQLSFALFVRKRFGLTSVDGGPPSCSKEKMIQALYQLSQRMQDTLIKRIAYAHCLLKNKNLQPAEIKQDTSIQEAVNNIASQLRPPGGKVGGFELITDTKEMALARRLENACSFLLTLRKIFEDSQNQKDPLQSWVQGTNYLFKAQDIQRYQTYNKWIFQKEEDSSEHHLWKDFQLPAIPPDGNTTGTEYEKFKRSVCGNHWCVQKKQLGLWKSVPAVFGLSEGYTPEDIRKRYKKLTIILHPDTKRTNKQEAAELFKISHAIYEYLEGHLSQVPLQPVQKVASSIPSAQEKAIWKTFPHAIDPSHLEEKPWMNSLPEQFLYDVCVNNWCVKTGQYDAWKSVAQILKLKEEYTPKDLLLSFSKITAELVSDPTDFYDKGVVLKLLIHAYMQLVGSKSFDTYPSLTTISQEAALWENDHPAINPIDAEDIQTETNLLDRFILNVGMNQYCKKRGKIGSHSILQQNTTPKEVQELAQACVISHERWSPTSAVSPLDTLVTINKHFIRTHWIPVREIFGLTARYTEEQVAEKYEQLQEALQYSYTLKGLAWSMKEYLLTQLRKKKPV